MFTFLAILFGSLLVVGGIANILGNFKDFEEIMKGVGTIFAGSIIILLCIGWKTKTRNQFLISGFLGEFVVIKVI